MITNFERAVGIALEDGYVFAGGTGQGLVTLFELFQHLAAGGNIDTFDGLTADEATILLGVAYATITQITID